MTIDSIRNVLVRHRLLRPFDSSAVDQVVAHSRRQKLTNGTILFRLHDPADSFFVLESGLIKLALSNEAGQEKVIAIVSPGESFAEAVMFMEAQCYPVTAEALETSSVIAIPNAVYRNVLRASPDACMALMADLSMRLHKHVSEINELTLFHSRPRIVRYLISQLREPIIEATQLQLPAPKHVIASLLAVTPETLSRVLHELEAAGVIRVRQRVIEVLDPEALSRLA